MRAQPAQLSDDHRTSQHLFQVGRHASIGEKIGGDVWLQFDEEIHIAIRSIILPSDGAEDRHMDDPASSELRRSRP